MASTKPTGAPAPVKGITIAQAVRDVLIASINKGQFPFAVMGLIVLLILWRLPDSEISPLIHWMVDTVGTFYYVGYGLFGATVFGWYFHAQNLRKKMALQMEEFHRSRKQLANKRSQPK